MVVDQRGDLKLVVAVRLVEDLDLEGDFARGPSDYIRDRCFEDLDLGRWLDDDRIDVIALYLATRRALPREIASLVCRAAAKILICIVVPGNRDRDCLLYTSPSPRDLSTSRMPSSA